MSRINELRATRAKSWEEAKAFLDSKRNDKGMLNEEDTAIYEKMENDIVNLGREIEREERLNALEKEMAMPVNTPITSKPETNKLEEKTGRASDSYKKAFWNRMRNKTMFTPELSNVLRVGEDSEGGYLVPDEYENTLVEALEGECVIRNYAHVFTTSNGSRKIPVVASKGEASWIDENGTYPESDDSFGQEQIDAHKLGTIIKVSEELLNDSAFNLEAYFEREFARRMANKEEEAFINGNGVSKPVGILQRAEVGVTSASATSFTADEIMDLFYSLKGSYRRNAIWVLNDETVKAIRKLKDGSGQYLWQPGLREGEPDLLLGKPLKTVSYMPTVAAEAKPIIFGDLSYYWIGDRKGISFKRLNEKYADQGQVGFLTSKRLDAKLVLPEAVKTLQIKAK